MRPETIPERLERFGLRMGEPLSGGWIPPALQLPDLSELHCEVACL